MGVDICNNIYLVQLTKIVEVCDATGDAIKNKSWYTQNLYDIAKRFLYHQFNNL